MNNMLLQKKIARLIILLVKVVQKEHVIMVLIPQQHFIKNYDCNKYKEGCITKLRGGQKLLNEQELHELVKFVAGQELLVLTKLVLIHLYPSDQKIQ
ncbi:unnamed protein product [Paramecium sonneborni]|uniref:Uncharacterized protein n=1 Tax=Paramecium sonneborni TaxID=65129 RepID=A0A8S1NAG9_9CILI|nr:unnamed protein product [Paramecium sonneborni]